MFEKLLYVFIGILIVGFVWLGAVYCKEVGQFEARCSAKGGIVLSTENKYVCVKSDALL